jgi:hypothetical protein
MPTSASCATRISAVRRVEGFESTQVDQSSDGRRRPAAFAVATLYFGAEHVDEVRVDFAICAPPFLPKPPCAPR